MTRFDENMIEIDDPQPPVTPRELWADGAMTVTQVAKFLAISRKTVFVMMNEGRLPWGRLGSHRRIPKRAVLDLFADRGVIH